MLLEKQRLKKTDEHGQSLRDLCILSQLRILNGRTLGCFCCCLVAFNTFFQLYTVSGCNRELNAHFYSAIMLSDT